MLGIHKDLESEKQTKILALITACILVDKTDDDKSTVKMYHKSDDGKCEGGKIKLGRRPGRVGVSVVGGGLQL